MLNLLQAIKTKNSCKHKDKCRFEEDFFHALSCYFQQAERQAPPELQRDEQYLSGEEHCKYPSAGL